MDDDDDDDDNDDVDEDENDEDGEDDEAPMKNGTQEKTALDHHHCGCQELSIDTGFKARSAQSAHVLQVWQS
jgi:hypothetical protein